jgi:hypothetical protein
MKTIILISALIIAEAIDPNKFIGLPVYQEVGLLLLLMVTFISDIVGCGGKNKH